MGRYIGSSLDNAVINSGSIGGIPIDQLKDIVQYSKLDELLGRDAGNYTGANDVTSLWATALAEGGKHTIPEGTYLLDGLSIPVNAGDIILEPAGPVTIKWAAGSAPGITFDCSSLWSASDITVSAVTDNDDFIDTDYQVLSQVAIADTSVFAVGDYCHIRSNQQDAGGYWQAEMFRVADVQPTYVLAHRKLFYTYGGVIKLRRTAGTPQLTILPGIKMDPADDETATGLVNRPAGIRLVGAIDPVVNIEFKSVYATAVATFACYNEEINFKGRNIFINYEADTSAAGYGVVPTGSYGGKYTADTDRGGHNIVLTGNASVTQPVTWWQNGAAQNATVSVRARNCYAGAADSHWSINARFELIDVEAPVRILGSGATGSAGLHPPVGASVAGYGMSIGRIITRNCRAPIEIRDHVAAATVLTIGHLDHDTYPMPIGQSWHGLLWVVSQTGASKVTVNVLGGVSRTPGNVACRRPSGSNGTHVHNFSNFRFTECNGIVRCGTGATWELNVDGSCTYAPGDSHGLETGVVAYGGGVISAATIRVAVNIMQNAAGLPNGFVTGTSTTQATTYVGELVLVNNNGTFKRLASDNNGAAVHTIVPMTVWNGRKVDFGDVAPSTGWWEIGDTRYMLTPISGGWGGWICTTAGNAGAGASFRKFAAVDTVPVP